MQQHTDTRHYSGNIVQINQATAYEDVSEQVINLGPGLLVQFNFALSDFIFMRMTNDLVMKDPQGSSFVLREFFVEEGSALPDFMLKDGTILPGDDFLAIMELAVSAHIEAALNDFGAGANDTGLNFMLDFDNTENSKQLDSLLPHNPGLQSSAAYPLFQYSGEADTELSLMDASAFNDFACLHDAAAFAEQSAMLTLMLANG